MHSHAIHHFQQTGLILPGHQAEIAAYRANTTRDHTESHR